MGKGRVRGIVNPMEKAEIFRRIFHMTAFVYLSYYFLPNELSPGFNKQYGVIIILSVVLVVEGLRLRTGKHIFGMRTYEKKRVSALAWFAVGMSMALLLFDMQYVVPVVIGMAFIDPLIGEIRRRKKNLYPILPLLIYEIIVFSCLVILSGYSLIFLMIFSVIATFLAILAEWWDAKYIDDDFLMITIPLLGLCILDYLFTQLGFI